MEALARNGASSLADLHRDSGIPKSTIRRLLGTLMARRIASRSLSDGKYRLNIPMPSGFTSAAPASAVDIVDIALPILMDLTRRIVWPSDFHLLDGNSMLIVDSTRPLSAFHLYRGIVNRHLNLFGSATGIACLSTMNAARINRYLAATSGDKTFGFARFGVDPSTLMEAVDLARAKGYATRIPTYLGETVPDDGLAAIAVPVLSGTQAIGAINLVFPRNYETPAKIAARYLSDLTEASSAISKALETAKLDWPAARGPARPG